MEKTALTKPKTTWTPDDIYQEVTDTIIQQLENGTIPWQKPIIGINKPILPLPINYTTNVNYNGVNIILLWLQALDKNFPSNEWATIKQWQKVKESIKPNEKETMIIRYDILEKEVDGNAVKIPSIKKSLLFNRSQLKSFVPDNEEYPITDNLGEKIDVMDNFVLNTKAVVNHEGLQAFYNHADDSITMPPYAHFVNIDSFTATENYYATLFRELGHWTGHKTRLDRFNDRFTKGNYAKEELVAELIAAFLSAKFQIAGNGLINSATYAASWLKELEDDKMLIISAASAASKAVAYLKDLQPT